MRFMMVLSRCSDDARGGDLDADLFAALMRYNEEMTRAGVLVTAEGLKPEGARVRVATSEGRKTVVDGPFIETKELVGAFYVIEVASLEEAVEWARRRPGQNDEIELRQLTAISELPEPVQKMIASEAPAWSASLDRKRPSSVAR